MNASLSRFFNPAMQATRRLDATLSEIADGVRELKAQPAAPSAPTIVAPQGKHDEGTETPSAPQSPTESPDRLAANFPLSRQSFFPRHASEAKAVADRISGRSDSIHVPDLRPELAALVSAMNAQHEATAQAFRQVTDLCGKQQREIKRLHEELWTLSSRLNMHVQRA